MGDKDEENLSEGENTELIPVGEFNTEEETEHFAKEQYYLYTGNFPFIANGMTCSYKSTGERKEIEISKNLICKLISPKDIDAIEYLIIFNGEKSFYIYYRYKTVF